MIPELEEILAVDADPAQHSRAELQFRKWRLIHKYVHDTPFTTNQRLSRSEQWRAAVDYARDIGEIELLDWILQQVQIATHLEQGIRDMRPRKGGPCHGLILEHVADRKRKTHAVHRWVLAARQGSS